jgi:hypothetical protein
MIESLWFKSSSETKTERKRKEISGNKKQYYTSKVDGKYKKVRRREKGASPMENNKGAENMSSQYHILLSVTQKTGWTAGTPIPLKSEMV